MTPQDFYELLPAIYRIRDIENGGPLEALMKVIGSQVQLIHADIEHLYDNWFIETCDDWLVPYIGELVGFRRSSPFGESGDLATAANVQLLRRLYPRSEVSRLVECRRRKGTRKVFEDLSELVAAWRSSLIESHSKILTCAIVGRDMDSPSATMRVSQRAQSHAAIEFKAIASLKKSSQLKLNQLNLLLWRRDPQSRSKIRPAPIKVQSQHTVRSRDGRTWYLFSMLPTGIDRSLAVARDIAEISLERFPTLKRTRFLDRGLLALDLQGARRKLPSSFYESKKSISLEGFRADQVDVLPLNDLQVFRNTRISSDIEALVDPQLARVALLSSTPAPVTYLLPAKSNIGGGEGSRPVVRHNLYPVVRIASELPIGTGRTLDSIFGSGVNSPSELLQVNSSIGYEFAQNSLPPCGINTIRIAAGKTLELRAANKSHPIIQCMDSSSRLQDITVEMGPGSRLVLDGLTIWAKSITVRYRESNFVDSQVDTACDGQRHRVLEPPSVFVRYSTFLPRHSSRLKDMSTSGSIGGLTFCVPGGLLSCKDSILAAVVTDSGCNPRAACPRLPAIIELENSIVHRSLSYRGDASYGAILRCRQSTILGKTRVREIDFADDSIFFGTTRVERRQIGAIRYSYVHGARLPRIYRCVTSTNNRTAPEFVSRQFGKHGYGELAISCPTKISHGAESGSEMGAFHNQFEPQRLDRLKLQIRDFCPVSLNISSQFVDETEP